MFLYLDDYYNLLKIDYQDNDHYNWDEGAQLIKKAIGKQKDKGCFVIGSSFLTLLNHI
jgi:hypothetical protein